MHYIIHPPTHSPPLNFEFHFVNWLPAPAILPATCIATSRQILFRHCEVPAKSSTGNRQSSASVSIVSSSSSSWSSRHGHVVVVLSLSHTHTHAVLRISLLNISWRVSLAQLAIFSSTPSQNPNTIIPSPTRRLCRSVQTARSGCVNYCWRYVACSRWFTSRHVVQHSISRGQDRGFMACIPLLVTAQNEAFNPYMI